MLTGHRLIVTFIGLVKYFKITVLISKSCIYRQESRIQKLKFLQTVNMWKSPKLKILRVKVVWT